MSLSATLERIEPAAVEWRQKAHARLETLAMPHWALGRLMDIAEDLAGMTRSLDPPVARRRVVVMAGDHGVAAEGVSKFPPQLTGLMVKTMLRGGAGINVLGRHANCEITLVDMGAAVDLSELGDAIVHAKVAMGTANFAAGPAMSREQAVQAVETGIRIAEDLAPETDVFATGEMGIANTTPATAILCALTGCPVEEGTGRGTGIDDATLNRKIEVIRRGLELNRPDPHDGLDVLAKVGGFEIGGLAGVILGAAANRRPVVVDGFISTSAALIAQALCPTCTDYMICAHHSVEPGHVRMLGKLGKPGLLDLQFRLGEGTGSAMAMHLLAGAVAILTEMFTLEEAMGG